MLAVLRLFAAAAGFAAFLAAVGFFADDLRAAGFFAVDRAVVDRLAAPPVEERLEPAELALLEVELSSIGHLPDMTF
ncbi:MAG: hypothetical protein ACTHN4_04230 [Sphingomicrobium sp.]